MSTKISKSLGAAIGATVIGSLSLSALAVASPTFQVIDLASAYALAHEAPEGKCGEGKCGVAKMDKDGDGKVSFAEAKANGFSDNQCTTWDENKDGSLQSNELAAMHAIVDAPTSHKKEG